MNLHLERILPDYSRSIDVYLISTVTDAGSPFLFDLDSNDHSTPNDPPIPNTTDLTNSVLASATSKLATFPSIPTLITLDNDVDLPLPFSSACIFDVSSSSSPSSSSVSPLSIHHFSSHSSSSPSIEPQPATLRSIVNSFVDLTQLADLRYSSGSSGLPLHLAVLSDTIDVLESLDAVDA
jgi:hypothetical protein